MAPIPPLGKKGLIRLLEAGKLPFTFGAPHPHHGVVQEQGMVRIRALQIDQAKAMADSQAARAAGRSWQPEHYYALGQPTGAVVLEAPTVKELIARVEALEPWPADW